MIGPGLLNPVHCFSESHSFIIIIIMTIIIIIIFFIEHGK